MGRNRPDEKSSPRAVAEEKSHSMIVEIGLHDVCQFFTPWIWVPKRTSLPSGPTSMLMFSSCTRSEPAPTRTP